MTPDPATPAGAPSRATGGCAANALRALVRVLGVASGAGLMAMVLVTTLDVALRALGWSRPGAYDLVKVFAALTIAAALPYTTAIKGHVAIEFFFHRLGRRGRMVVDAVMRLGGMGLFGLLAWGCVALGNSLWRSGEVSLTLQLPIFWVPYVLAASCGLVVLIKIYHLLHPGQPLIRP
ncbi:MAG: TRAP transporter small permease [Verrucomicrobia bacterium]|nr:TRAP transporter small permease [Verrucomicrobiota bacterium]